MELVAVAELEKAMFGGGEFQDQVVEEEGLEWGDMGLVVVVG